MPLPLSIVIGVVSVTPFSVPAPMASIVAEFTPPLMVPPLMAPTAQKDRAGGRRESRQIEGCSGVADRAIDRHRPPAADKRADAGGSECAPRATAELVAVMVPLLLQLPVKLIDVPAATIEPVLLSPSSISVPPLIT